MAVNQHESRGSITLWIKAALFSHETLSRLLRNKFNRWETRYINHFPIVLFFVLKFCLLTALYRVFRHYWMEMLVLHGVQRSAGIHPTSQPSSWNGWILSIFRRWRQSPVHSSIPADPVCNVAKQFCRKGGGAQQHQGVAMRYQKTLRGWYALLCREVRGISGSRSERTQAA